MASFHATAYEGVRERVSALIAEETAGVEVPATPGWAVRDVVAHLCGLGRDWLDANLEGYGTGEWTARHVSDRARLDVGDLVEEWAAVAERLGEFLTEPEAGSLSFPIMTTFGPVTAEAAPVIVVTDAVIHEHDIRGALDTPGARDSDAVAIAMRSHVAVLRFVAAAGGLPDMVLVATDTGREWRVGRGEPEVMLEAPAFELFRATAGRRSRDQIEVMGWSGAAEVWMPHLVMPAFSVPSDALVE